MLKEFKNITNMQKEMEELLEAYDILEQVWLNIGPYNDGKVSNETLRRINNLMKFDDSE